jgi:bifunctional non-homologous end joining protein LigD
MLATTRPIPRAWDSFSWEFKWDGARCGSRARPGGDPGRVRLDSRNGKDVTSQFPEIVEALAEALPARLSVALDGELVASAPGAAPDFAVLQRRLGTRPSAELLARVPVTFVAFDLVWSDGPTVDLPYLHRRELLAELAITHPRVQVPPHHLGVDPHTLLELAESHGLEGLIGKCVDSRYRPGRSSAWVKVVLRRRLEVWIGGWLPSRGGHGEGLGALLVGRLGPPRPNSGRLRLEFYGGVGTGWAVAEGRRLQRRLTELQRATSPFAEELPREYARHARWVEPELSAQVEYRSFTAGGLLRHAAFKGLTR